MKFFVAALVMLASLSTLAQSRIVSIDAFDVSYTGGLMFKNDNAIKNRSDREETTLRLNLNFAQNLPQYVGLMWKGEFHWNRTDIDRGSDSLESVFGASGGILYNLESENIKNSFFGGAQAGLERMTIESGNKDESGFNLYLKLEAGKRWDMGQYASTNISYAPTVELTFKRYGGDIRDEFYTNGHELRLNFLKFDILF
jgi:hypothetical protein